MREKDEEENIKVDSTYTCYCNNWITIQQAVHVTHAHDLSVDTIHVENYQADEVSEAPVFSNEAKAVRYVRDQLKQRSESITLNYAFSSDEYDKVSSLVNSIINKAEEYTGINDEGDYIVYKVPPEKPRALGPWDECRLGI